MRLPWSFGRKGRSAGAEAAGSGTPAIQRVAARSAPSGAWRELPPIQRAVPDMPLVAEPAAFVQRLPGSQGLPPILEPLGHEVSALATPGLVVAHPHAVEGRSGGALPAPASRRGRRSDGPTAQREAELAVAEAADGRDAAPGPAVPPDPVAAATAEPVVAAAPQSPPVRSVAVISREVVRTPDRPLTSASGIAPTAQRSSRASASAAASPATGSHAPTGGPPTMPVAGMRRARADSSIGAPLSVSRSVAADATAHAPGPTRDAATAVAGAGQPRRSGLGPPLAELPSDLRHAPKPSGRAPAIETSPHPARPDSGLQRSVGSPPPLVSRRPPAARTPTGDAPAPAPALARDAALPILPVIDRARAIQRQAAPPAATAAAPRPAASARPTVGRDPLRPRVAVQREAPEDMDDGAASTGLPAPWWAPAAPTADARAALDAGAWSAPAPGGTAGLVGPTVARSADGVAPVSPVSARSGGSPAPTRTAQRAVTQPPPMPVARPAVSSPPPTLVAAGPAQAAPAAPAGSIVADTGTAPGVQRMAAPAPAPAMPPISTTAVVQRVDGAAPEPATSRPSAKPSDRELDELAVALFGRIRGRLRNELIHDREAKGLTFDHV